MNLNISQREYAVLKILWKYNRPITVTEIAPQMKHTSLPTLHATLNSLMDKGLIKVVGSVKLVKVPCRLYEPKMSMEAFASAKLEDLYTCREKGFNIYDFVTYLIKKKKGDKADIIKNLEKIIEDYKTESEDLEE